VTGPDVVQARGSLGLTVAQFADLIGVSLSTVYRWEQSADDLSVEPFPRRQLELAGDRERQLSAPNHRQLAQQIRVGVAVRGGLYGLCLLLASVFSPAAREDREGRLLAAAGRHNDRAGARRSRQGGITWGE